MSIGKYFIKAEDDNKYIQWEGHVIETDLNPIQEI